MTTRRWWGVLALGAAVGFGSWSLASASVLEVEGGILQTWRLEVDLPAPEPRPGDPGSTDGQPEG